ncbi:MAG TPA: hypothetical protein VD994_07210 [Prosthecobacter sp.]|nr:hypothetical protein [Prosthecobacter sp.]
MASSSEQDRAATLKRPVPFVVITGQGDERVAVEMMKRGALDYLVKDGQFLDLVPIVVQRTLAQLDRKARLTAAEGALRASTPSAWPSSRARAR